MKRRDGRPLQADTGSRHLQFGFPNPDICTVLPRQAGHRCGTTVMRKWARRRQSSQTGSWWYNRHPTFEPISASIGERAKRRFRLAAGSCCEWQARSAVDHFPGERILVGARPASALLLKLRWLLSGLIAVHRGHTWRDIVEMIYV